MAPPWNLSARWVFPVAGPPLANGILTIRAGVILAVEPAGVRRPDLHLGNAAILPGLVNAHTHLDLTHLAGRCPPSADFVGWLRQVVALRRSFSDMEIRQAVAQGIRRSTAAGTTLLGDIAAGPWSAALLRHAPLRAVVYHEILGLSKERAASALQRAADFLHDFPQAADLRPGLSPHAPYSVRRDLFRDAAALQDGQGKSPPLAVHVAESAAEMELLADHSGPLVEFLRDMGVWDHSGLIRSVDELAELIPPGRNLSLVHGNHLRQDLSWLQQQGRALVFCPRTHAAFGHPTHPWRDLLAAGIEMALGTDSLASNPDLDILEEGRFLFRHAPELAERILHLMTLGGARTLGFESTCGSLTPGKSADFLVLPLPNREERDPHRLIFDSANQINQVFWVGKETFS